MGNKNITDYERDKKMNIVFVILHYKLYSVTKECIEYLLKQDYEDIHIVIVFLFAHFFIGFPEFSSSVYRYVCAQSVSRV